MNWLAHLFLCESDVESRLGNILADLAKGSTRSQFNPHIQAGIRFHQLIDRFTDTHPIVKHSKSLIAQKLSRFSGILIDVFYDHFLIIHWLDYTSIPLDEFIHDIYKSFRTYPHQLPAIIEDGISKMMAEDWLGCNRDITGITTTLMRISRRLQRRHPHLSLLEGINSLNDNYQELESDFCTFFPELINYSSDILTNKTHILVKSSRSQQGCKIAKIDLP